MDEFFMKKAIELATNGEGKVNPNPLVGAVIVKEGKIISSGYHKKYGENHAEINAIENTKESLINTTIYVTLEPCCHKGKTPPCVDRLIKEKFKKVVIGMKDPNPVVSGKGIEKLKEHGIEVVVGVLEEECKKLNEIFTYNMIENKPFVAVKWAMTLDGKIASKTYDSKWISSEQSREYVHELRNKFTGIMVGINTVLKDNPMLTCRIENGVNPIRVIVDSKLRIPLDSNITNTKDCKTIVATISSNKNKIFKLEKLGVKVLITKNNKGRVDLKDLMEKLYAYGIDSILIEGGGELIYSALEDKVVNKVYAFIAPKILGGKEAITAVGGVGKEKISQSFEILNMIFKTIEKDLLIEGNL